MLTEKQLGVLRRLYEHSRSIKVHTTLKTQERIASDLGITRQGLSTHLKILREKGLIRTGRGFIDLTDKALKEIGKMGDEAFVIIKVKPKFREKVFEDIRRLDVERVYRITGDIDIIAVIDIEALNPFLKSVSKIEGVEGTSSHVVVEMYQVLGGKK